MKISFNLNSFIGAKPLKLKHGVNEQVEMTEKQHESYVGILGMLGWKIILDVQLTWMAKFGILFHVQNKLPSDYINYRVFFVGDKMYNSMYQKQ